MPLPDRITTPAYLARVKTAMDGIRELCRIGATKVECGRYYVGPEKARTISKQQLHGTIANFLNGRVPAPPNLAKLEKWIAFKKSSLRRALK